MSYKNERYAEQLAEMSADVVLEDQKPAQEISKIAAFDCAVVEGRKLLCAAVIVDAKTMQVIEKKTLLKDSQVPYIPGYNAFREGPLILELYYSLENDPDVIMLDGEGICHPDGGGLAMFVGVELAKPVIGVTSHVFAGEQKDESVIIDGKVAARIVRTRQYSNPLFVSPGNMITVETAAKLVLDTVRLPHKLPEPLHIAHRIADKQAQAEREGKNEDGSEGRSEGKNKDSCEETSEKRRNESNERISGYETAADF